MASTSDQVTIAIGADSAGADLKNALKAQLQADPRVREVIDFGVPDAQDATAYPHVGLDVAQAVARGDARRGLLVCGTGIGMAITANKVPGIRATVAHDSYSVERSVLEWSVRNWRSGWSTSGSATSSTRPPPQQTRLP